MKTSDLELEKIIEKQIDFESRKLFNYIAENGSKVFLEGHPLHRYKDTELIERLIQHFESIEEYEKCSVLLKVKKSM